MNIKYGRIGFFVLVMIGCLVSGGCDLLYRLLDEKGSEEKDLVGDALPYEPSEKAEEVQTLLTLYGYGVGEIDGIIGLRTRNAIAKFQEDNQMEVTRKVDRETWERLNEFRDNRLVVDLQLNVALVQSLLKKAGFDPGKVDGKLGSKTQEAVLKFQKAQGLKVDGKIGYKTLSSLSKFISEEPQNH